MGDLGSVWYGSGLVRNIIDHIIRGCIVYGINSKITTHNKQGKANRDYRHQRSDRSEAKTGDRSQSKEDKKLTGYR